MFGFGGDPCQGINAPWSVGPGPLGNLPNQVAGVLNSADQNHLRIPIGQDGIVTLPRPERPVGYMAAPPPDYSQPPAAGSTGSRGGAAVAVLLVLAAALIVTIVVALT
jgi:hypothetical protein